MKNILALISFTTLTIVAYAQQQPKAAFTAVKYERIHPDPFANMPKGKLGLDYYYVDQFGEGERLWYEIVVMDHALIVHFHSKGTLSLQTTDYEYQGVITETTLKKLKAAYKKAALIQKIKGVPVINAQYTTKEILITKNNDSLIGGGWYYANAFANKEQVRRSIDFDKQRTTSLLGNPELMIAEIKKLCPSLDVLLKKARKP